MNKDALEVLYILEKVAGERRGIKPKFTRADVYLTLYNIYSQGPIGRLKIASILGLGEASVKTLVKRLKEEKLVETDIAAGIYLTNEGEEYTRKLLSIIPPPQSTTLKELAQWENAYAIKLENMIQIAEKLGVITIRDKLVRYGADAALIIAIRDKPVLLGAEEYYHPELRKIAEKVQAKTNDLVMVAWSREHMKALKALIEESIDLIKTLLSGE